jgi:NAD(P)H-flavin reductase
MKGRAINDETSHPRRLMRVSMISTAVGQVGRMPRNCIYVCQSGTCRSKGADAALVEIEELAKLVGNCDVKATGCLGYCSQGPAVEVVWTKNQGKKPIRDVHVKVNSIQKSAAVIKMSTGIDPPLENLPPETESRLSAIRMSKQREYFAATHQWNKALSVSCGLTEESIRKRSVRTEFETILIKAGYPDINLRDMLTPALCPTEMPTFIEGFVSWALRSIEVVSSHSAIYSFETKDLKRGTPHPRGHGKLPEPNTWHVTMLGEVGFNEEGPLPWIERDYTPISSALEWERGRCDILIKVYNDGQLSSWLHQERSDPLGNENEKRVWLSKPHRTLTVPALVPDDDNGFRPASVLLLLAGTGIVALPQILAHREPSTLLGISTPRYKQLNIPIDLIHSCREDDVLLLPQIKQYCKEGMSSQDPVKYRGLRNYMLLLTGERVGQGDDAESPPFQEHVNETNDAVKYTDILKDVENAKTVKTRLTKDIVANAIRSMTSPYRVIVSGPDAFNNAARGFLEECDVNSSHVTILSA